MTAGGVGLKVPDETCSCNNEAGIGRRTQTKPQVDGSPILREVTASIVDVLGGVIDPEKEASAPGRATTSRLRHLLG